MSSLLSFDIVTTDLKELESNLKNEVKAKFANVVILGYRAENELHDIITKSRGCRTWYMNIIILQMEWDIACFC